MGILRHQASILLHMSLSNPGELHIPRSDYERWGTPFRDYLVDLAKQSTTHVHALLDDGLSGGDCCNVAHMWHPELYACLARMDGPRHIYHSTLGSTRLVASLAAALTPVDWVQLVRNMSCGYQPKSLSRPPARAYLDPQPADKDEMERFVMLRMGEAATVPEVLLFALHVCLRASCGGFFQPFEEPDLLPQLYGGGKTTIWAVFSNALTALLEAHPEGFSAASPNAAYMADDILHVEALCTC